MVADRLLVVVQVQGTVAVQVFDPVDFGPVGSEQEAVASDQGDFDLEDFEQEAVVVASGLVVLVFDQGTLDMEVLVDKASGQGTLDMSDTLDTVFDQDTLDNQDKVSE